MGFQIEVTQVVIHEADEPDGVVNFLDAGRLTSKEGAEVDFFVPLTDPAAIQ